MKENRTSLKVDKDVMIYRARRFTVMLMGALVYAFGVNWFVVPSGLYSGGVMGFAQVFRTVLAEYLHITVNSFDIAGLIYYAINIPIFLLAYRHIGKRFFFKNVLCVTAITVFLSMIPIPGDPVLPDDILANCIIGGIICGFGTGLMLKMGGSSGGMDIIGLALIKWRKNFSVGKINLMVNAVLYGICFFLFDVPTGIYSLIYASVSSVAMDRVHAQNINVEVNIVTKASYQAMADEIFTELGRGITKWEAKGAYTGDSAEILYVLLSKYEVGHLKHIVRKYDPKAFIVINEGVTVDGHYLKKIG